MVLKIYLFQLQFSFKLVPFQHQVSLTRLSFLLLPSSFSLRQQELLVFIFQLKERLVV